MADATLVEDLLAIARAGSLDLTGLFRDLARLLRAEPTPTLDAIEDRERWEAWRERWEAAVDDDVRQVAAPEGGPAGRTRVADAMDEVNPVYIPRNHLVEEAIAAAHAGNLEPFHALDEVLRSPFVERPGLERYAEPADPGFTQGYVTFCGT